MKKQNYTQIVVDVETDGPCPGLYSMICFGAVIVDETLDKKFYGQLKPISDVWIPDALRVSGFTREQCLEFPDPQLTMQQFGEWISTHCNGRPIFWSDNNGFDFAFINYYFHRFLGNNPFGWTSQNLNSFYKGLRKNRHASFKHLRKTKHDHNPVNDATGIAEALLEIF